MDAGTQVCTHLTLLLPAPQLSQNLPFELSGGSTTLGDYGSAKTCRNTVGSKEWV